MFAEGQVLKFDPFLFKNGAPSKPKYYVVLKHMDFAGGLMMASLPTSQDHVPGDLGLLPSDRLEVLRQCLKQSPLIKRKYYKLL